MYWKTLRREETRARNLKESLLEPENKIKVIMPTNTQRTKLML